MEQYKITIDQHEYIAHQPIDEGEFAEVYRSIGIRDDQGAVQKRFARMYAASDGKIAEKLRLYRLDESLWQSLRAPLAKCRDLQAPVVAAEILVVGELENPQEVWLGFRREDKEIAFERLQGQLSASHLLQLGEALVDGWRQAQQAGLEVDIPGSQYIRYAPNAQKWRIWGYQWPYSGVGLQPSVEKLAQLLAQGAQRDLHGLLDSEKQTVPEWWQQVRENLLVYELAQLAQCEKSLREGPEPEAVAAVKSIIKALWGDSPVLQRRAEEILSQATSDEDGEVQAVVEMVFALPKNERRVLMQWRQRHPDGEEQKIYVLRNERPTATTQVVIPGFSFLRRASYSCGGASHTVEEYLHEETEMEFALLPGGVFMMGSPESDDMAFDKEKPQHQVVVKPFLMARYPTTQDQWQRIVEKYRGDFKDVEAEPSHNKGAKRPVEKVSWLDCQRFAQKIGLVLPSEAQWEYACRAGTTTRFYWGDEVEGEYLWYSENSGIKTHPVGEKKPNAFGLYDMSGNVWEWCVDEWHSNYRSAPIDGSAWGELNLLPASLRVCRGGGFADEARHCPSAFRRRDVAGRRWISRGVRFSRPLRP